MEDVASSSPNAGGPCTCNICLLHPHLKEALRRMQPPELRLYSRTELLELLEKDIANACDEQQKQVAASEESWWHLCSADPTFPFYVIPTKEFIAALASYLASRIKFIRREAGSAAYNHRCNAADTPAARSSSNGCSSSSCCSRWDPNRPITILECGAGTGILAAHLLPLLEEQLQTLQQSESITTLSAKQHQPHQHEEHRSERSEQVQPLIGLQATEALLSQTYNDGNSPDMSPQSADDSPQPAKSAAPVFSYVASEPRAELKWCPTPLAATREGCRSVMERHCPQLVICCWMPFNVDWTEKARESGCACCRGVRQGSSNSPVMQQHHHSPCQVKEYILIGHAEGGLVGRPLETWGMRCPDASQLPLGVDYEIPQESTRQLLHSSSWSPSEEDITGPDADEHPIIGSTTMGENGIKRRRESVEGDERSSKMWKSANNFRSLPPDVPAAKAVDNQAIDGCVGSTDGASSHQQHAGEFRGMGIKQQLLPLHDRPYYREGFFRLPPKPTEEGASTAMGEGTGSNLLLEELRRARPLSRFDSLHSLRARLPSASQIVVFRRMSSTQNI